MTAGQIVREPPQKTRISLKSAPLSAWEKSNLQLFPGEAAISYETDSNGKKFNFKLKIGALDSNGNKQLWKNLPFVTVDKIDLSAIDMNKLKTELEKYFMPKEDIINTIDKRIDDVLTNDLSSYITTDNIVIGTKTWYLDCGSCNAI